MSSIENKNLGVFALVEPTAFAQSNFTPEQCALFSIAVSMKRIADTLASSNIVDYEDYDDYDD